MNYETDDKGVPITAADAVKAWDDGQILWTLEMGGMGPGYEQAIHVGVIELLRAAGQIICPTLTEDKFAGFADKVVPEFELGLSGAQGSAIYTLAFKFFFNGYAETVEKMRKDVKDRMIMVSNHWPQVKVVA